MQLHRPIVSHAGLVAAQLTLGQKPKCRPMQKHTYQKGLRVIQPPSVGTLLEKALSMG